MKALISGITCFGRSANEQVYLSSLLIVSILCIATTSHGALVLTLNTVDKTFAITGEDKGFMSAIYDNSGLNIWKVTVPVIPGAISGNNVSYNNDVAFETSVGDPGNGLLYDTVLILEGSEVVLKVGTSSYGGESITGTGVFQSYALQTPESTAMLEQAIGEVLVDSDTDPNYIWDSISVVAIPEPASLATLIGAMVLVGTLLVRWHKRLR